MEKFEIKNMLYKVNLKSRALSVILYLIDRANKDLVCFPAIKTISSDLNISVSTTKRALNNLVEIGFIEKIERFLDTTGKQTSNLYVINVDNIEKVKNVEKVEKVKEQEEKIILEVFEPKQDINIKDYVVTNVLKEDVIKIKTKEELTNVEKIKNIPKNEYKENSIYKNIDKNLTIIKIMMHLFNFKCKNFKGKILKKIKNTLNMQFLFRNDDTFVCELERGSFLYYI